MHQGDELELQRSGRKISAPDRRLRRAFEQLENSLVSLEERPALIRSEGLGFLVCEPGELPALIDHLPVATKHLQEDFGWTMVCCVRLDLPLDRGHRLLNLILAVVEDVAQDVILRIEIIEDRAHADAGGLGNRTDSGRVVAVTDEQGQGSLGDAYSSIAQLALVANLGAHGGGFQGKTRSRPG